MVNSPYTYRHGNYFDVFGFRFNNLYSYIINLYNFFYMRKNFGSTLRLLGIKLMSSLLFRRTTKQRDLSHLHVVLLA